jgi:large subunit ribosomal protein L35
MPKQKTRSSAKKRFKVTGTGEVRIRQAGIRHNFENMSGSKKRRKRSLVSLEGPQAKIARRTLGRSKKKA